MTKRGVIFAPSTNTGGKGDATEFRSQATMFLDYLRLKGDQADLVIFDNRPSLPMRAQAVAAQLAGRHDLNFVAFFCHGWPDGIQAGFVGGNVAKLAKLIHDACTPNDKHVTVVLDCCSTGEDGLKATDDYGLLVGGDGGFADRLADALVALGRIPTVTCHVGAGHTSKRPYVRVMRGGQGGPWAIAPKDALWPRWVKKLATTDLRWRYPWMTEAALRAELST